MCLRVLLVDANAANLSALKAAISPFADVDAVSDFRSARELLRRSHYDRLVANFRLGAYNGLHLVYVVDANTRSIVYTEQPEGWCSREVHEAGALYENYEDLQHGIAAYLEDALPSIDPGHDLDRAGSGDRGGAAPGAPGGVLHLPAVAASTPASHWIF